MNEPVDLEALGAEIKAQYESIIVANGLAPLKICLECGRMVTGPYGYLVTKAIHKKDTYKHYIGVGNGKTAAMASPSRQIKKIIASCIIIFIKKPSLLKKLKHFLYKVSLKDLCYTPYFGVVLSIFMYQIGVFISHKLKNPVANPLHKRCDNRTDNASKNHSGNADGHNPAQLFCHAHGNRCGHRFA